MVSAGKWDMYREGMRRNWRKRTPCLPQSWFSQCIEVACTNSERSIMPCIDLETALETAPASSTFTPAHRHRAGQPILSGSALRIDPKLAIVCKNLVPVIGVGFAMGDGDGDAWATLPPGQSHT